MEKYYTPEIEEFCIGFEFEYRPRLQNGIMAYVHRDFEYDKEWYTTTFGKELNEKDFIKWLYERNEQPTTLTEVKEFLQGDAIRVKYLDTADIESLGFKRAAANNFTNYEYKIIRYGRQVGIAREDSGLYCFLGTIKNKSEFKRVLTQIGVM